MTKKVLIFSKINECLIKTFMIIKTLSLPNWFLDLENVYERLIAGAVKNLPQ